MGTQPDTALSGAVELTSVMQHIVKFSGGMGSWMAARRVASAEGTADLRLLFTDTLAEDSDLYRFLIEAAAEVFGERLPAQLVQGARQIPEFHEDRFGRRQHIRALRADMAEVLPGLVWIEEGRDPWEVFRDERMLGNSRFDPCSRVLKRQIADRWLTEHCDPTDTRIYIGIDWTETHRFDDGQGGGAKHRWAERGWQADAPLIRAPFPNKNEMMTAARAAGIEPPALNVAGYSHNNCGGFCCRAGQGHFAHRLRVHPERYAHDEALEEEQRANLGKDVSMLSDRAGDNIKKPLTLRTLRERIEAGGQVDMYDIGGCGCFVD